MRGVSILTVIIVLLLGPAWGGRVSAGVKAAPPFNPSGDYHPARMQEGAPEPFVHFDLEVRRRGGRLVAWGVVKNVGAHYKFAAVSVTERTLKFKTVSVRGVMYSFEGRFLGGGDFPAQFTGHGIVMLEGTLTKFERGRKTAEIVSPFLYYPGC